MKILKSDFFSRNAVLVAQELIGKVIFHNVDDIWLSAKIVETEAYQRTEKASHSSLGFTEKRKALFMVPGTIYMYYARGKDSFNISSGSEGDAVLIKSGVFYPEDPAEHIYQKVIELNPNRQKHRQFSGQTILCKSLGLKVTDWNQQPFDTNRLYIADVGYKPQKIIQTTRLGIPKGRDEHLMYRFVDFKYHKSATMSPLKKGAILDQHYTFL